MVESAPNTEQEAKKRRSTRIVQAVPLTVTGVDALGRPFQERTSSLIINCHGCRYQSKHYVLKNMWVTLEVPHPEPGQAPRNVRGKVTWIQRPRTVRELFQVGVELEVPGNVWGIAFPPEDWFPFPEGITREIPVPGAEPEAEAPAEEWPVPGVAAREDNVRVLPAPGGAEASATLARQIVRMVVEARQQAQSAVREATARTIAEETRPLLDTIHSQLKEAAEKGLQEAASSYAEQVSRFRDTAERSVQASVASYTEQVVREAIAKLDEARQAGAAALGEQWSREIERRVQEAGQQFAAQLAQVGEAQRGALDQQLENSIRLALERLKKLAGEIGGGLESLTEGRQAGAEVLREQWGREMERRVQEVGQQFAAQLAQASEAQRGAFHEQLASSVSQALDRLNKLGSEISASVASAEASVRHLQKQISEGTEAASRQGQETLEGRTAEAAARLEKLEKAARDLDERITTATTAAQAAWRGRLDADLAAAGTRWQEKIETSLESAARQAAELLARQSQTAAGQLEQDLIARAATLRQSLGQTAAEAQDTLGTLRAALDREGSQARATLADIQQAESRLGEYAARLEALGQATAEELQRRLEAILAAESSEMSRRAESAVADMAERLQPVLEGAGQQILARLAAQLEQQLGPHVERANELLQRLATTQNLAEESLRAHQERLRLASEQSLQESAARWEESVSRFKQVFREADRAADETLQRLAAGQGQAEEALHAHQEQLRKASEQAVQETAARIYQTAGRFEREFQEAQRAADETLQKLTAGQGQAEEALHAHQEQLRKASEQSVLEVVARLQESLDRFEKDFQEAGRTAAAKWVAEIDAKATDITHTTFEALYKSSEWYEKKVQTHMQATLDKGLEQASNALREKAGEISGLFASELDHYSRSYVEHSQGQMDEGVKDAVDRTRGLLNQLSETTVATCGDEVHRAAQGEFERFSQTLGTASEQSAAQLEAHAAQVRSRLDAEARQFFVEFHKGMAQEIQQGVALARQSLEAQVAPMKESWRLEREAQERQLQQSLARLGDESIDAYKKRLENTSNSWLVATVTTLSQQSQDTIAKLATAAEQRLRETCSQVFAGVGESLRQRMLDLSTSLAAGSPPPEKK